VFKEPKSQLIFISISSLLTLFSLICIVVFTDPFTSSWITFGFFYISLFLFTLGALTLLGLVIRQVLKHNVYVINLSNSFRQAFLFAILVLVSFALLSNQLLYWWVELSIILFLLFVEIFLNIKT
jgi:hypothetical protein